jgi:hypothetical protein
MIGLFIKRGWFWEASFGDAFNYLDVIPLPQRYGGLRQCRQVHLHEEG